MTQLQGLGEVITLDNMHMCPQVQVLGGEVTLETGYMTIVSGVWEVLSPWRSYDARDRVLKVESPWRLWMFPPRTVSGDGGHPGECTYVTPGALSARGTCWCLWTCDPGGSFWVLFSP